MNEALLDSKNVDVGDPSIKPVMKSDQTTVSFKPSSSDQTTESVKFDQTTESVKSSGSNIKIIGIVVVLLLAGVIVYSKSK
jgi:hypothetical protein